MEDRALLDALKAWLEPYLPAEARPRLKRAKTKRQIDEIVDQYRLQRHIKLRVAEVFRGPRQESLEVVTGMGGGDCGFPFQVGGTYLVYAERDQPSGRLSTDSCTPTALLSKAAQDLAAIRRLTASASAARISGFVTQKSANGAPRMPKPVTGVTVILESGGLSRQAATDKLGMYIFDELAPGDYRLSIAATAEPARSVTLATNACSEQSFTLERIPSNR